jgi:antitoxin (DNA-binding transcriptional repressor) of toxin-antitoxin stability system
MKDVKVTELRQNLPAYLARVKRGERLRVTSRGKVIAELSPPTPDESEVRSARERLRSSVLRFDRPTEPVFDPDEWDVNR